MIQSAPRNAVTTRMTADASHVALVEFCEKALPRDARMREDKCLVLARTVVEVEPTLHSAAVHTAESGLYGFEESPFALDVAPRPFRVACAPSGVSAVLRVSLALSRFVAFPGFRRVVRFTTRHMGILSDTWGDEALNHVSLEAS